MLLERKILNAPVVHVDETKVNIRGISHYAWVLTDGDHVVFKLSESREMTTIQPLLDDYAVYWLPTFTAAKTRSGANSKSASFTLSET